MISNKTAQPEMCKWKQYMKWMFHKNEIDITAYWDHYHVKDTDDMMLISTEIKRISVYFHLCLIYAKPSSYRK